MGSVQGRVATASSPLYFRSHLLEAIDNYTFYLYFLRDPVYGGGTFLHLPSSRLIRIALENFKYPWDVQTSMFLLLCLLNVFQVLLGVKQLFKNTTPSATVAQYCAATPTPATGTAISPTPTTGTAATQTPVTGTVVTQSPETGTATERVNQPVPVSVTPIHKNNGHKSQLV